MRENRAIAVNLQLEHKTVESKRLLNKRILDNQMPVGERLQQTFATVLLKKVVEAVFRGVAEFNGIASFVKCSLQGTARRGDGFRCVGKCAHSHMRRCENALYTPLLHGLHQLYRTLDRGRAVVNAWKNVAVYIRIEPKLLSFLFTKEIEHSRKYNQNLNDAPTRP